MNVNVQKQNDVKVRQDIQDNINCGTIYAEKIQLFSIVINPPNQISKYKTGQTDRSYQLKPSSAIKAKHSEAGRRKIIQITHCRFYKTLFSEKKVNNQISEAREVKIQ